MLKFMNGPASGVTLFCARAPLFLRVVMAPDGKFDALDQLDDDPKPGETLFAYRKSQDRGFVHLQLAGPGGRGRRCRWEKMADYQAVPVQPDDAVMRDRGRWQNWCRGQVTPATPGIPPGPSPA